MITKALHFNTNEERSKEIFWGAVALIGLCACMYIYCITATVRNIVENKNLVAQASDLSGQISAKEFSYIALQNTITLQYAQSMGFSDAANKVFITPTSVSFVSSSKSDSNAL